MNMCKHKGETKWEKLTCRHVYYITQIVLTETSVVFLKKILLYVCSKDAQLCLTKLPGSVVFSCTQNLTAHGCLVGQSLDMKDWNENPE